MGNYMSSEFAIYGRNRQTNSYALIEEIKEGNPMSRFKHETFTFSLRRKHIAMKSLYLYCGYSRLAKCTRIVEQEIPYIVLEFATEQAAKDWDACKEQIPKVYVDMPWLEGAFFANYSEMPDTDVYTRRYQNFKLSMKS